jgi:porin
MIWIKSKISKWVTVLCLALIALMPLGLVQPAAAQQAASESINEQAGEKKGVTAGEQDKKYKSGYEDVPQFGGPSSAGAQLEEDNRVPEKPVFRFDGLQRALKPYYGFKEGLNKNYGLSFGLDYTPLFQWASDSLTGEDKAAGGIFRFYGNWTLLGRESGNTGSIVYKVESRHRLGTDIAPQDLGFEIGYFGLTSGPFSDFGWGLTNLYWQQKFKEGRISFIAGVVDSTDYVDLYGLINPWTAFSNLAFLTDPTIAVPNQGLGAAVGVMATDNLYVVGGLADANGDPTQPGDLFETFFDDQEYFYHLEIGWTSSFERRYFDNIHLTGWYADERKKDRVPDGWGLAFSAAWFFNDTWMPFLRAGWSDGEAPLLNASVGAGIGYYFRKRSDLLGFGLNWGKPAVSGLDDQYTAELFYRLQFSPNFAITPDVQLLINPALNPAEDLLWVFGLRARLTL